MAQNRRDKGSGSIYLRNSDQRWVGTFEAGYNAKGKRVRYTVTGKTEAEVKKKLRDKRKAWEAGEVVTGNATVKSWADTYLAMRVRDLSPNGYHAAASPIRKWVVPTIGRRRLSELTPADIRAVAEAQRAMGLKNATQAATHRALLTMLRTAVVEGHQVPMRVLLVKAPKAAPSDRTAMTIDQGLACLEVAATLPHGVRWLISMLYGMRQGEVLGLTWDAIDFDTGTFGEIVVEWQLQTLPYNKKWDATSGFRLPDGYECRHLVDSYHLVRPKSKKGWRVAPLLPPIREALLAWRDVAPENPWGLVFPNAEGRPSSSVDDREEWYALQATAEVAHPNGRHFLGHECRNFAATMLLEARVDESVVTALLGHSSIVMSRKYLTVRREPLLEAMTAVGERLQLTPRASA